MNAATPPAGPDPFATASMVPMLPCASIDELRDFWNALGCEVAWFQHRPNPYVALKRGGMDVHYYGLDGHRPEDSHSTCSVVVDDTGPFFESLAEGLRAQHGRLPLTGFPRITRPRPRANNDGLSGFSLIDPAGTWLWFTRRPRSGGPRTDAAASDDAPLATTAAAVWSRLPPLSRALSYAVVQADSHGKPAQARATVADPLAQAAELRAGL